VAVVVRETVVKAWPADKPRLVGTQRACCHRGRAKRDSRRKNAYYCAHERSSLGDP
jgi:hypothetical protein